MWRKTENFIWWNRKMCTRIHLWFSSFSFNVSSFDCLLFFRFFFLLFLRNGTTPFPHWIQTEIEIDVSETDASSLMTIIILLFFLHDFRFSSVEWAFASFSFFRSLFRQCGATRSPYSFLFSSSALIVVRFWWPSVGCCHCCCCCCCWLVLALLILSSAAAPFSAGTHRKPVDRRSGSSTYERKRREIYVQKKTNATHTHNRGSLPTFFFIFGFGGSLLLVSFHWL